MNINQETTQRSISLRVAFTTREAASYLGLAVSTLNKWRCYGTGPKYLKLGRAIRYTKDELDIFLETRMVRSTLGA